MKTAAATLVILAGVLAGPASAQTTLPWLTLDSGGGTSSSALYAAHSTIGQMDAFHSTSADYQMRGGFWAVSGAPSLEVTPALSIARGGLLMNIWWPSSSAGFVLEENTSLTNSGGWSTVGNPPLDDGTTKRIILPVNGTAQFFRLKKN